MPDGEDETRWLDAEERAVWLGLARTMVKLPGALDAQLERDAGLNYFEYIVMAMLSEQPDRTLRMSQLAAFANGSLSRLSHVATRLEAAGYLCRAPDEEDRRATKATLTAKGMAKVVATAPGHVTEVRELVFDAMSREQMLQLRSALEAVLERVDPAGTSTPFVPANASGQKP